jgi:hypothetical protein
MYSTITDKSALDWDKFSEKKEADPQEFIEIDNDDEEAGNVHIPSGGISISDEFDDSQKDRFVTKVIPIRGLNGVAQLLTSPVTLGSFEPIRYLVAVTPPRLLQSTGSDGTEVSEESSDLTAQISYVLIDVPPFSPQLVARMNAFMGPTGVLSSLLITSRDGIHYDEMPSVFTLRRADLDLWRQAFPKLNIVSYRLDTPRDCRPLVTQVLDGYGPFAMLENGTFIETGRPLTVAEWEFNMAENIMKGQQPVPDDEQTPSVDEEYLPEAIKKREEGYSVLAVYTPGHSYGSVSYVFPQQSVVASGFTIPVEDNRMDENLGDSAGPSLDCRGYISTSRAGIQQQIESARELTEHYIDRFSVVLPSRGEPLFLEDEIHIRRRHLEAVLDQYDRIGEIYSQLGITSSEDDE